MGLESFFKYCCENLKLLLRKPLEHLKQIKQADGVGHADRVGHADHVGCGYGHVKRLHVGLINGDSIDYNDKSGDEVPFIILKSFRLLLFLLLISFKCLRKLYLSIHYLSYLVCLACHVCLVRLVCLVHLAHSKNILEILIRNTVWFWFLVLSRRLVRVFGGGGLGFCVRN